MASIEKQEKNKSQKQSISFDTRVLKIPEEGKDTFYLWGSRCQCCGNNYFPAREICPQCYRDDAMRPISLSKQGKLYSFSIIRRQTLCPPGFSAPYAFGYIDLSEGVRVLARLKEWEPDLLRLNLDMELCIERVGKDKYENEIIGFYFRPAHGAQ